MIAIHLSDGGVKPGGPLGAFREEKAMSQHRVSPATFLSSSYPTLHKTICESSFIVFLSNLIKFIVSFQVFFICDRHDIRDTYFHFSTPKCLNM